MINAIVAILLQGITPNVSTVAPVVQMTALCKRLEASKKAAERDSLAKAIRTVRVSYAGDMTDELMHCMYQLPRKR